jgi:hypothetical protein
VTIRDATAQVLEETMIIPTKTTLAK